MINTLNGLNGRELEILDQLHKDGPMTKSELAGRLDLKLTTLNRSMRALEERKLIAEAGISESTGGRKPSEYDVARTEICLIGADISRTYVQLVVMDMKLRILKKLRFEMQADMSPQLCVDRIAESAGRMLQELSIPKESVPGIGVGTVGPMDRNSGVLLRPRGFPNPGWADEVPLAALLRSETGLPCVIDNGANSALLAEHLFGAGRAHSCVAYIHCGVGLRSAVIRDGAVIHTMNDREDALAHMTVDLNGEPCACGGRGCLERLVSLAGLRERYAASTGAAVDYAQFFARAGAGDPAAVRLLNTSADILGIGLSNLSKLMSPDLIILSGPLISEYRPFFTACVESFRRQNRQSPGPVFKREGSFGEDVVAIGAGLMVLQQYLHPKRGN